MLADDYPAIGLLRYVSEFGIQTLVLGSYSSNYITRYAYAAVCLLVKPEIYVNVCTELNGIHLFASFAI